MRIDSVLISGNQWVHRTIWERTNIKLSSNGTIGECTFTLFLTGTEWASPQGQTIRGGREVIISNNLNINVEGDNPLWGEPLWGETLWAPTSEASINRIFAGKITKISPKLVRKRGYGDALSGFDSGFSSGFGSGSLRSATEHGIELVIICKDYTYLLERIVDNAAFSGASDKYIIQSLFSQYLPEVDITDVEEIVSIGSIANSRTSLRNWLEAIARISGAVWHVDQYKKLRYFAIGSRTALFGISEAPDFNSTHYAEWSGFNYDETFELPGNKIQVRGALVPATFGQEFVQPSVGTDDARVIRNAVQTFTAPSWPPINDATPDIRTAESNIVAENTYSAVIDFNTLITTFTYLLSNAYIKFNTAAIQIPAGAQITSVSLHLYAAFFGQNYASATNQDSSKVGIEYYSPENWPITNDDWTHVPADNAAAFWRPPQKAVWQWWHIPLQNTENINWGGETGFRLHLRANDNGSAPTGANFFAIESFESSRPPRIVVAWTIPETYVGALAEDLESQSLYGIFDHVIIDDNVKTVEEAQLIADTYLASHAHPDVSGAYEIKRDGLEVGEVQSFDLPSIHLESEQVIRSLTMRWVNPLVTQYTVEFGTFKPDLYKLLRKMNDKLNRII